MTVTTTTRNATMSDLVALLRDQHARKLDIVVPAARLRARDGNLIVKGADAIITEAGVTTTDGVYRPTVVADEGVAAKLGIPVPYVRKLRLERPDLWDANVNGWLAGRTVVKGGERTEIYPADDRSFLLRAFRGDDGGPGVARALVSDKFALIDNLDVLTASLDGARQADAEIQVDAGDLSDRNMFVRLSSPSVSLLAPELLKNYRSPFSGQTGADNPVIWAGIEIKNSEVGNGAFTITPRMVVQVCSNGLTVTRDAMRAVHLGAKLDEGQIKWTEDTNRKALDLITAKARDAVATFLDVDYMRHIVTDLERTAGAQISNPAETIKVIGKKLAYSEETMAGVLDHFIKGGTVTAGGVLHAVTSYAQTVADADTASELESKAMRAMELAAATR